MAVRGPALQEIWKRHCMHKTSNQQMVAALQEYGWEVTAVGSDLEGLVRRRSQVIGGSSLSEELIGSMKNTRKVSNHTR